MTGAPESLCTGIASCGGGTDPDEVKIGGCVQAASAAAALSLLAGSPALAYNIMDDINAPASPPKSSSSEPASALVAVRGPGDHPSGNPIPCCPVSPHRSAAHVCSIRSARPACTVNGAGQAPAGLSGTPEGTRKPPFFHISVRAFYAVALSGLLTIPVTGAYL